MAEENTEQTEIQEAAMQSLGDLDAQRVGELNNLLVMKQSKVGLETRNLERLKEKYGEEHPLVEESSRKLEFGQFYAGEINLEVIRAETPPPLTDGKAWLVHGYVFNEARKPVSGATVMFFGNKGNPIPQSERALTGLNGYYVLETVDITDFPETAQVGISKDELSELIFTPQIGVINYAEINVPGGLEPPSPGVSDWSVKGKVVNAEGEGMGNLSVSVYDKDPSEGDSIKDDFLGKTTTGEDGVYILHFTKKQFSDLGENYPELYLIIENESGEQIYGGRNEALAKFGQIELWDTRIGVDNENPDE